MEPLQANEGGEESRVRLKLPPVERSMLNLTREELERASELEKYQEKKTVVDQALQEVAQAKKKYDQASNSVVQLAHLFDRKSTSMPFEERAEKRQELLDQRKLCDQYHALYLAKAQSAESIRKTLVNPLQKYYAVSEFTAEVAVDVKHVWLIGIPAAAKAGENRPGTVYYGAYSDSIIPPTEEWRMCSTASIHPAPIVRKLNTAIETWKVENAGCKLVNGKYVKAGEENGIKTYVSSTGIYIFRRTVKTDKELDILTQSESVNPETTLGPSRLPPTAEMLLQDPSNFMQLARAGTIIARHDLTDKSRHERERQQDESNLTLQEHSLSHQPGPLVVSRKHAVPDLCHAWVLMHCSAAKKCKRRHYYISQTESLEMLNWKRQKHAKLELLVLKRIAERETLLENIEMEGKSAIAEFQTRLSAVTLDQVEPLLGMLSQLRLTTVQVFEAIAKWREHTEKVGWMAVEHGDATKPAAWSVTLTVDGSQLYGPSPAFDSKFKRYRRDADPKGKRAKHIMYLGCVETRMEAERLYDLAAAAESRKLNIPVSRMPKRRALFRSCGFHFAIESEGQGPSICEECSVKRIGQDIKWTPSYLWNGMNYIMKISSDTDFLAQILPLVQFLANREFPLLGNPFLLPKGRVLDPDLFEALNLPVTSFGHPETLIERDTTTLVRVGDSVTTRHVVELSGDEYEVLDMDRVLKAQRMLLREEELQHDVKEPSVLALKDQDQAQDQDKEVGVMTDRIVSALYWERCAAIAITQRRPAKPFKQPDVFCRTDVGEWSKMVVRGKHTRHYEFEQNLLVQGREKSKRRKNLVGQIRKLLSIDIVVFEPEKAQDVLDFAKEIKGDVVGLEAKKLKDRILYWYALVQGTRMIQRVFRAMRGRTRAILRRRLLQRAERGRILFEETCGNLALVFWKTEIVPRAIEKAVHELRKPAFTTVKRWSGEDVIVTAYSLRHFDDMNSSTSVDKCWSCLGYMTTGLRYSAQSHGFERFQPPCTCKRFRTTERILIRAYEPMTSNVYRLILDQQAIRDRVRQYHSEHHLPSNTLLARACRLEKLPTDVVLLRENQKQRVQWEPIHEAMSCRRLAHDKSKQAVALERKAAQYEKIAQNLVNIARKRQEEKQIALRMSQHVDDQLIRARENYHSDTLAASEALAFSRQAFLAFSNTEAQKLQQASDRLENAHDAECLVQKRKAELVVKKYQTKAEQCRLEVLNTEMEARAAPLDAQDAILKAQEWKQCAIECRNEANSIAALATIAVSMMNQLLTVLINQMTLKHTGTIPLRRTLLMRETFWRQNYIAPIQNVIGHQGAFTCTLGYDHIVRLVVLIKGVTFTYPMPSYPSFYAIVQVSVDYQQPNAFLFQIYDPRRSFSQQIFCSSEIAQALAPSRLDTSSSLIPQRRNESRRRLIAQATRLGKAIRFDHFTGKITLSKIGFERVVKTVRHRLQRCRWWKDLKRGKKSGKGDEVYREAKWISNRFCHVIVFENWGDLVFQVYHGESCTSFVCLATFQDIILSLSNRPLLMKAWAWSVQCLNYSDSILSQILDQLVFLPSNQLVFQTNSKPNSHSLPVRLRKVCLVNGIKMLVMIRATKDLNVWIQVVDPITFETYTTTLDHSMLHSIFHATPHLVRSDELFHAIATHLRIFDDRKVEIPLLPGTIIQDTITQINGWISRTRNPIGLIDTELGKEWEIQMNLKYFQEFYAKQLVIDLSISNIPDPIPIFSKPIGSAGQIEMYHVKGELQIVKRDFKPFEIQMQRQNEERIQMRAEERLIRQCSQVQRQRVLRAAQKKRPNVVVLPGLKTKHDNVEKSLSRERKKKILEEIVSQLFLSFNDETQEYDLTVPEPYQCSKPSISIPGGRIKYIRTHPVLFSGSTTIAEDKMTVLVTEIPGFCQIQALSDWYSTLYITYADLGQVSLLMDENKANSQLQIEIHEKQQQEPIANLVVVEPTEDSIINHDIETHVETTESAMPVLSWIYVILPVESTEAAEEIHLLNDQEIKKVFSGAFEETSTRRSGCRLIHQKRLGGRRINARASALLVSCQGWITGDAILKIQVSDETLPFRHLILQSPISLDEKPRNNVRTSAWKMYTRERMRSIRDAQVNLEYKVPKAPAPVVVLPDPDLSLSIAEMKYQRDFCSGEKDVFESIFSRLVLSPRLYLVNDLISYQMHRISGQRVWIRSWHNRKDSCLEIESYSLDDTSCRTHRVRILENPDSAQKGREIVLKYMKQLQFVSKNGTIALVHDEKPKRKEVVMPAVEIPSRETTRKIQEQQQRQCRLYRMEKYCRELISKRHARIKYDFRRQILEWPQMVAEDAYAMEYRQYLSTLDHSFLMRVCNSYRDTMQVEHSNRFELFLRAMGHELDGNEYKTPPEDQEMTFLQVLDWYLSLELVL